MSYSKEELAKYRIARSKASLEEAKFLSQRNYWNTVANRLYYSCFYIASAYLVIREMEASTHNGIKIGFNKWLIRQGELDKRYGELYNNLFNLRQDADYRDYKDVSGEKIEPFIKEVEELVSRVEKLICEFTQ